MTEEDNGRWRRILSGYWITSTGNMAGDNDMTNSAQQTDRRTWRDVITSSERCWRESVRLKGRQETCRSTSYKHITGSRDICKYAGTSEPTIFLILLLLYETAAVWIQHVNTVGRIQSDLWKKAFYGRMRAQKAKSVTSQWLVEHFFFLFYSF